MGYITTFGVLISDKLRELLVEISDQSVVADLLLSKELPIDILVESHVNFICVSSDDPTKISYLTDDRKNKIVDSEYWTSKSRYHSKPGGFVTKLFNNISSKDVEIFSNLFKNVSSRKHLNFKIVKGDEISKYYLKDIYLSESGSLGSSCMKYDSCQEFFDIYKDNDNISMLVALDDDGLLIGRCLLWHADGVNFMDRIYTINDECYQFYFKEWGSDNYYNVKSNQNCYDTLNFGSNVEMRIDIKLSKFDYMYYPYLDTFKFLNAKGILSNYENDSDCILGCPEGGTQSSTSLKFDHFDRVYRHSSEVVHLGYLDVYANERSCNYSSLLDVYIYNLHSEYNSDLNDYIFNMDMIEYNYDIVENAISIIKDKEILENRATEVLINDTKKNQLMFTYDYYMDNYIDHYRDISTQLDDQSELI